MTRSEWSRLVSQLPRLGRSLAAAALAAALLLGGHAAHAEAPAALAPLPKECQVPGAPVIQSSPLPNVAKALRDRKKIRILAIGGTSASMRGPASGGHYAIVEQYLENSYKGLEVDVVHRGVSGELAAGAGERIRNEVALTEADLVLWQLGTADAMARVPLPEFRATVSRTLVWLKEHNVDVILVGLRYARKMATDEHYQATRRTVEDLSKELGVLRIGRYLAEETLGNIRKSQGPALTEMLASDADYACLAEYMARAIAAGLFVKDARPSHTVRPAPSQP